MIRRCWQRELPEELDRVVIGHRPGIGRRGASGTEVLMIKPNQSGLRRTLFAHPAVAAAEVRAGFRAVRDPQALLVGVREPSGALRIQDRRSLLRLRRAVLDECAVAVPRRGR